MSWEIVGDTESLGQFASNAGLAALVKAAAGKPALDTLFETGESDAVDDVIRELMSLETPDVSPDVVGTARGLVEKIRGQRSIMITDGLTGEDGVDKADDGEGHWVTIDGHPVLIGGEGQAERSANAEAKQGVLGSQLSRLSYTPPKESREAVRETLSDLNAKHPDVAQMLANNPLHILEWTPDSPEGMAALYYPELHDAVISTDPRIYANMAQANPRDSVGYGMSPRDARLATFMHEVGHHFHTLYLAEGRDNSKVRGGKEGKALATTLFVAARDANKGSRPAVSEYARTNRREYFAETFAAYHTDRENLRKSDPTGYAAMEKFHEVFGSKKR